SMREVIECQFPASDVPRGGACCSFEVSGLRTTTNQSCSLSPNPPPPPTRSLPPPASHPNSATRPLSLSSLEPLVGPPLWRRLSSPVFWYRWSVSPVPFPQH